MSGPNFNTYRLLINSLRRSSGVGRPKPVLFLGAGCSLSSSRRDITTSGLMREFVEEFGGSDSEKEPDTAIYRLFTNIKERTGNQQFCDFLEERLGDLHPSEGYRCAAQLVEAGIFQYILTTNFDLLLDDALAGIRHHCYAGECSLPLPNDDPALIKIHGDIRGGLLRFTPNELRELPPTMSDAIRELTRGPVLVVGYRGQDQGVMKSLHTAPEYNAFWSSFDPVVREDSYTHGSMLSWLRSRKSEENILHGHEFGDFDTLMRRLVDDLVNKGALRRGSSATYSEIQESKDVIWNDSAVHRSIAKVPRLKNIFCLFSNYASEVLSTKDWCVKPPAYFSNFALLKSSYLRFLRDDELPVALLSLLENEADALIFAAALEIKAWAAGLSMSCDNILQSVRAEYDQFCSGYVLPEEFWQALHEIIDEPEDARPEASLRLFLNNRQRLVLIVERVPLERMRDLLKILDILVLCLGADERPPTDLPAEASRVFATKLRGRTLNGDKIRLDLMPIPRHVFAHLVHQHLSHLSGAAWTNGSGHFQSDHLEVVCEQFEALEAPADVDLFAALSRESDQQMRRFMAGNRGFEITPRYPVRLKVGDTLRNFLKSSKSGCLLIGSSGSGKTTAIKELLDDEVVQQHVLPIAVSPRTSAMLSTGLSLFISAAMTAGRSQDALLRDLDSLLVARQKTLILILDGLNEVHGSEDILRQHFESILDLVENISIANIYSIKVIITCRDASFEAHLMEGRGPSPEHFYSEVDNSKSVQSFVRMDDLSRHEQDRLVEAFFDPTLANRVKAMFETNGYLALQFTHPYLIAVASQSVENPETDLTAGSASRLFGSFAEAMLRRINNEGIRQGAEKLLRGMLELSLTAGRQCWGLSRFQLLEMPLPADRFVATPALRALCDVNILRLDADSDRVDFVHERMTEYFLGRLLRHCNDDFRIKILRRHDRIDPVLIGGFRVYFDAIVRDISSGILLAHPARMSVDLPYLLSAPRPIAGTFVEALAHAAGPVAKRADFISRIVIECDGGEDSADTVAALLCRGAKETLNGMTAAAIGSLLDEIEKTLATDASDQARAELLLLRCQAARLAGDFDLAETRARESDGLRQAQDDSSFADRIEAELATVARERGRNGEAIERLQIVFDRQWSQGAIEQAFVTSVELGAALRNDTRLKDAFALYDALWNRRREVNQVHWIGLLLGRAVIEKNWVQSITDDGDANLQNTSEKNIRKLVNNCFADLDQARILAERSGRFSDLLAAASEAAELHLVLYRFYGTEEQRELALAAMADMERRLAYLPEITCRIELCRYRALFAGMEGDVKLAFRHIDEGRKYASERGMANEAADCDYLQTRIAAERLNDIDPNALQQSIVAADRAITHYMANMSDDNAYLVNVRRWRELLQSVAGAG